MVAVDLARSETEIRFTTGGLAAGWLAERGIRADLTDADRRSLIDLRRATAALLRAAALGETPPRTAVDVVNAASAGAAVAPQVNWPVDGRPRMWLSTQASPAGHALGILARAVIDLLTGPQRGLLRICSSPHCQQVYLATNPRRRWCSYACGNRVRVARHAARRRDATGSGSGRPGSAPAGAADLL
jgi:predicted RNA-binding Zn ribbon-like protein